MRIPPFFIDLKKRFPTLANAPIVEAVLDWRAAPTTRIEETALQCELVDSFPDFQLQRLQEDFVRLAKSRESMEIQQSSTWTGFRLEKMEDGKLAFVCQFRKDAVIFSRLAPYRTWEEFESEGKRFWTVFCKVLRPIEISRLGTRFISQMKLQSLAEVQEFIQMDAEPLSLPGSVRKKFFHQDSLQLNETPYELVVTRTVQPGGVDENLLIVDIDVFRTIGFNESQLPQVLQELRAVKNEVFFNLMKNAEARFGEGAT